MPFVSQAQAGYLHAHPEILGEAGLKEWDEATRGKHLPKHVHHSTPPSYALVRKERKENG
jgi:hypothetical protein